MKCHCKTRIAGEEPVQFIATFAKQAKARFTLGYHDWSLVLAQAGICLPNTEALSSFGPGWTLFQIAAFG
jgi:hypothetical protein